MTEAEQLAADNKARAEITKLIETTTALSEEIADEHRLYPLAVVIIAVLTGVAIGMAF